MGFDDRYDAVIALEHVKMSRYFLPLAALLFLASANASERSRPPPDPLADPLMIQAGFLSSHPDLRFRILGHERYKQGKHDEALKFFRRASFYADKPSQAMVAEMLWNGEGEAQDRALAYAWMDLAAERGYPQLIAWRERYWAELDEDAREQAVNVGEEVYAKYGDAAAKPRIAGVLRRERSKVTGSRTGVAGSLQIVLPDGQQIAGSKFYDPQYWDPEKYQQWHDATWTSKTRVGRVHASDLQEVPGAEPGLGSRVPETAPDPDAVEPEVPAEKAIPGG
ncbi:MAG: hypothetical protein NVV60_12185 [Luteimonas sp.]|nr:hypothetical protein [Luteimonas sp.]